MAVNKVDVNGVTVLDLTQDSVTPETLKKGETTHNASGVLIVGTMETVMIPKTTALLRGDGVGGVSAAVKGTDYAAPSVSFTVTLTTSGWAQSGSRYYQTKSVTGVTASTPVVLVDVALSGTDIDADAAALEAWGIVSANNVAQGNGTLTFYALSVPSVNIPVNVGVC